MPNSIYAHIIYNDTTRLFLHDVFAVPPSIRNQIQLYCASKKNSPPTTPPKKWDQIEATIPVMNLPQVSYFLKYLPPKFLCWRYLSGDPHESTISDHLRLKRPGETGPSEFGSDFGLEEGEGGVYLEDHPRNCKWLGSPLFTSHEKAIYKGSHNPI